MDENNNNEKKIFKVPHRKSPHYISDYATGTIISGPTNDGLYHLIFYSDAISINSETGINVQSIQNNKGEVIEAYELGISDGDVEDFREDKAKIALSKQAIVSLIELLKKQISDTDRLAGDNEQAK